MISKSLWKLSAPILAVMLTAACSSDQDMSPQEEPANGGINTEETDQPAGAEVNPEKPANAENTEDPTNEETESEEPSSGEVNPEEPTNGETSPEESTSK
jgi:uncharacterized lipoprotein